MFDLLDGDYHAAEAEMLLTSPSTEVCIICREMVDFGQKNIRTIVIDDDDTMLACISALRRAPLLNLRETSLSLSDYSSAYVAYAGRRRGSPDSELDKVQLMTAKQYVAIDSAPRHIELVEMNAKPWEIGEVRAATRLRSLGLSRLELNDSQAIEIFSSGRFRNLRWIDLSGNPSITVATVEAIATAVDMGVMPFLEWLDLLGTDYDATPYIDGFSWRISDAARPIAERVGYQRWMMLGCKIREFEAIELLPAEQRKTPPNRFTLP